MMLLRIALTITKVSNDNGYFTGPNLRYLEEKELDGYIPDSNQPQKMKGKKLKDLPYSKDKFEYDDTSDGCEAERRRMAAKM